MPQLVVGRPLTPSYSTVDTAEERDHYWRQMLADWGVAAPRGRGTPRGFPGCNPLSLSRAALQTIRSHPYVITLKSDGVRFALYLTTRPDSTEAAPRPIALLVDRARNMYEVEVLAPASYFVRRTLLEGELVWQQPDEQQMLLLVFDCLRCRGEPLFQRPFEERHTVAKRCVGPWTAEDAVGDASEVEQRVAESDTIALAHYRPRVVLGVKHFVARTHAAELWRDRAITSHRVDGVILQRADASYTHGTANDASVLKWKEHSTLDLAGRPGALRAADGPVSEVGGRVCVVSEDSRVVADGDDDVVEYLVTVEEERVVLFALRRRPDKTAPNGLRVVAATVQDVVDAVAADELAE